MENMATETLGEICNAHVVHADLSQDGASDPKCIRLAELAATTVDQPKTGQVVTMPEAKARIISRFHGETGLQVLQSTKILGELYRQITGDVDSKKISSDPGYGPGDITYDIDLDIPGADEFTADAYELKCSYDMQLKALMGQYSVTREVEVVTGHVWSMPKRISKKRGELQEQLKQSYIALKKEYRECFERMNGDFELLSDNQKNSLHEKKASAWYIVTYHPEWVALSVNVQGPDRPEDVLPLSFPWIAADYLARIKIKCCGMGMTDYRRPIKSLTRYLAS